MFRSVSVISALAASIFAAEFPERVAPASSTNATEFEQGGLPGPPREAIDACKNKDQGDACTVNIHGNSIEGTCRESPDDNESLICFPEHMPAPPGPGGRGVPSKDVGASFRIVPS